MVDSTVRNNDSTPALLNDKIIDAVVKATIAAQGSVREQADKKVAAYGLAPQQTSEAEQLAHLQQQVSQLITMLSGNQTIAAYQPTPRDTYNRDSRTNEEIHRLREENRQLKAAQGNSNFQTGRNAAGLDGNKTSPDNNTELSRALEEIRRMQARMNGFMRTYAICLWKQS